jgi:phage shock protein PspC (stress-responsive transcriptional regulator)
MRRLERLPDDRIIAGVCSGIARFLGINATIIRVAVVFLTLVGWWTVLLYLAGWALMPAAGRPPRTGPRARVIELGGLILLVVGGLAVLGDVFGLFFAGAFIFPFGYDGGGTLGPDGGPGPFLIAAALVVVGMILLRRRADEREPEKSIEAVDHEPTVASTFDDQTEGLRPTKSPATYALTLFTLAAAMLIVGTAALLASIGVLSLDIGQLSAMALLLVGVGLLVGSWWGRSRLLIAIGVLLVPWVLVTSVIDIQMTGRIGTTDLRPRQPENLESVNYAIGAVRLDLTRIRGPLDDADLKIRVGVGDVDVLVPPRMLVATDVNVRGGGISVFSHRDAGTNLNFSKVVGDPESAQRLNLDIDGGLVGVQVHRAYWLRARSNDRSRDKETRRARHGDRQGPHRKEAPTRRKERR